ncbi:MAG TPA: DUF2059 domain-containing protein [Thermoanaerobaculia bacterium]|nr:DUF2059 domain-containing protein [Thermoanaerobaculia bacterium]
MKRAMIVGLALACLSPWTAWAAEAESSHRTAAAELLTMMDLEKTVSASVAAMVDAQVQQNPMIERYKDVMVKWAEKVMSWEAIGPKMIDLYMETFTEPELRELITFYKTPIGKKALQQMPVLMQKGAMIGAEQAEAHSAELEEMIRAKDAELEKKDQEENP